MIGRQRIERVIANAAKYGIDGRSVRGKKVSPVRLDDGSHYIRVRGDGGEVNAARAKDGTYDEWVQKSFSALAQLNPGRYGKVEIGEQLVESIR